MEERYKIFDSHSHYDDEQYDVDREQVLKELKEDGVIGIIDCASSYNSIDKVNNLTKKWDYMYGALGIHPENADEFSEAVIDKIKEMISQNEKIVAIGEIGLDYYWDENPS